LLVAPYGCQQHIKNPGKPGDKKNSQKPEQFFGARGLIGFEYKYDRQKPDNKKNYHGTCTHTEDGG
jgi:hypothetical protein